MAVLVTGAAGFIGSTLVDALLREGRSVRGVDSFSPYYDPAAKRANLESAAKSSRFDLVDGDLLSLDMASLLRDVDVVYHLAGQPGVRLSWADGFEEYVDSNIRVTQRLLEAVRASPVRRFVYASSSSVYGDVSSTPTLETDLPRPHSPYGVTKLAGEQLCGAYAQNFDVPTTSVRFFTVYGPRQRPDMAFHRMIEAALDGSEFPLFGDGRQIRDFTYVDDIVDALMKAAVTDTEPGTIVNAAGGGSTELLDVVELIGTIVGLPVHIDWRPAQAGDVRQTGGSIELAHEVLGWAPRTVLGAGLERQVEWHRARRAQQ